MTEQESKTIHLQYWGEDLKDDWYKDVSKVEFFDTYVVVHGDTWNKIIPVSAPLKSITIM